MNVLKTRAELSKLSFYAVEEWLLIFCLWLLMAYTPYFYWILWVPLLAGRFHALGVLLHDACHQPRIKRTPSLSFFELLAGLPIATTWNAMKYHHLRHHLWNGSSRDPYFKPRSTKNYWEFIRSILIGFLLVPFWIIRPFVAIGFSFFGRIDIYQRYFLQEKSEYCDRYKKEVRQAQLAEYNQAVFWILVLIIGLYFPKSVLQYYILPLELAGVLNVIRVLVEHEHVPINNADNSAMMRTTRAYPIAFTRSILFPRNIGYHVAHHLYPELRFEFLPEVTKEIVNSKNTLYEFDLDLWAKAQAGEGH